MTTPLLTSVLLLAALGASAPALPPKTEDALPALREGRWSDAAALLERVVAENPSDGLARYYLGASYERLSRCSEALPALRAALELGVGGNATGMRAAHLGAARCSATLGEAEAAISHLEEAWTRWGFDALSGILADERFALLHDDPRLRSLAGIDPRAEAGDRDARWLADVDYLRHLLTAVHPSPFHTTDRAAWEASATHLEERIDELTDLELTAELMRLVAAIGDGHTALYPPVEGELAWHLLPIFPVRMADGWFVAAAAPEHADLAGARISGFAGRDWQGMVDFAAAHLARDNLYTSRWLAGVGLQFAELYSLASGAHRFDPTESVELELELADGSRVQTSLRPGAADRNPNAHWAPAGWRQAAEPAPRWIRDPEVLFRLEMLPERQVLYARLLQTADFAERSLAEAGRELRRVFAEQGARALVLDLRLNNGGDAGDARGFVNELIRIPELAESGHFAVLIGPRTFSATGYLLGMFEKHLEPLFVGWPSGCRPVGYSSERAFRLPYTGLTGSISYELRVDGYGSDDLRPSFVPDLLIWPTGEDLRTGADPVLEAALLALN